MDSRVEAARSQCYPGPGYDGAAYVDIDVARGLLAFADERLKVNVGLLSENTSLKQQVRSGGTIDLSSVPVLELLQEIQRRAGE